MLVMVIDLCGFTRGDREVFFSTTRRTAATPFWTCGVKAPDDDVVVLCANIFGRISALLLRSKKVNNGGRERVLVFSRRCRALLLVLLLLPGFGSFRQSAKRISATKDNTTQEEKMRCFLPRWSHKKCLLSLHTKDTKKQRGGKKHFAKKKKEKRCVREAPARQKNTLLVLFPLSFRVFFETFFKREQKREQKRERERERLLCVRFQKEVSLSLFLHTVVSLSSSSSSSSSMEKEEDKEVPPTTTIESLERDVEVRRSSFLAAFSMSSFSSRRRVVPNAD